MKPVQNIRDVANKAVGSIENPTIDTSIGLSLQIQEQKFTSRELSVIKSSIPTPNNFLVRDMSSMAIRSLAAKMRKEANMKLGTTPFKDSEEEGALLGYIAKAIAGKPLMTYQEVISAFNLGIEGAYLKGDGDFVHFSVSNLSIWFKKYIEDTKTPVMVKYSRWQMDEKRESETPSEDQLKQDFFKIVNDHVREVLEFPGRSIIASSYHYDSLLKYGLYQADEEEFNEAKKVVSAEVFLMGVGAKVTDGAIYAQIYKNYIKSLAEFRVVLDKNGEQVEIESLQ